jgi:hypothetical protein
MILDQEGDVHRLEEIGLSHTATGVHFATKLDLGLDCKRHGRHPLRVL